MPPRIYHGRVVRNSGNKTIVVGVQRVFKHPLLGRTMRRVRKFHVHDEDNKASCGDEVSIQECPPKSRMKRWKLLEKKPRPLNTNTSVRSSSKKSSDENPHVQRSKEGEK